MFYASSKALLRSNPANMDIGSMVLSVRYSIECLTLVGYGVSGAGGSAGLVGIN